MKRRGVAGSILLLSVSALAVAACHPDKPRESPGKDGPAATSPGKVEGQVATSASSEFRVWSDRSGCVHTATTNRRFTPVVLQDTAARPRRLVLAETFALEGCEQDEVSSAAILTVTARAFDARHIERDGWSLETRRHGRFLNEYHTAVSPAHLSAEPFCCADLYVVTDFDGLAEYYSLGTGALLYMTRDTLIRVEIPDSPLRWRFAAFQDRLGPLLPPEAERDSSVLGVLQYGDELRVLDRLTLVSDQPLAYQLATTRVHLEGAESDSAWPLHSAAGTGDRRRIEGFSVLIELYELALRDSPPLARIEVPVLADELDVARARLPAGLHLRR